MYQNLLDKLRLRLGYKEEVTLSREEFRLLIASLGTRENLEELEQEISNLESTVERYEDIINGIREMCDDVY